MQNLFAKRIAVFCAFCKSQRRVYRKKRIGFADVVGSALGALVVMGFVFQDWDPRVFLIFVAFLALAETFIQLRWRMSVVCPHCGFDAVLYTRNPEEAARKVVSRLDRRKEDPVSAFLPPLQIPKRKVKAAEDAAKPAPGKRLSKQV